MSQICYRQRRFGAKRSAIIDKANEIIQEYQAQGYDLTGRQIFYRFVALGELDNTKRAYEDLLEILVGARYAGLIDWEAIVDRSRNLQMNAHWKSPKELIAACARRFQIDLWQDQPNYVEVWVEKEALAGVLDRVCRPLDVPFIQTDHSIDHGKRVGGRR